MGNKNVFMNYVKENKKILLFLCLLFMTRNDVGNHFYQSCKGK